MGISLAGLIQGLTTDASGALAGIDQRKQLEQQALHQRLADELLKAQAQYYRDRGIASVTPKPPPTPKAAKPAADVGASARARVNASVQGQETQAAARNALAALDQADAALAKDPNADIYPTTSAIAEGAGNIPVVGGMLKGAMGPLAQSQLRPTQQQYQQAMDQFLHNYSALLPKGGRSVAILQNLRNSFTPRAGQESVPVRQAFREARANLRKQLQALANGHEVGDLPTGSTEAPVPNAPQSPSATPKAKATINWDNW